MAINNLTVKKVESAKAKEKAYTLTDGGGLRLLVKPDNSKIWEFVYTSPTLLKRRKTTFKSYPSISLKQAREEKDKYTYLILKGLDPIEYYKEEATTKKLQENSKFNKVFKEWIEHQEDTLSPATYKRKYNLFKNDVLPVLKNISMQDIKHPDIVKILKNKSKKTPETARRLFNYFDDLWKFATTEGYCEFNIITNIHKKSVLQSAKPKHYPKITDITILKELIQAIYSLNRHYNSTNALKLVLHVPLRAQNLSTLKWSFINFETRILTIPRNEMKVKDTNLPDFKLYLTDEVISILTNQYQYTSEREYIFTNDKGSHMHPETPNRNLEYLGFNDEKQGKKQRLHSFRGTFRSLAETYHTEHKARFEIMEAILDHQIGSKTQRAYNHEADYISEIKPLLEWWSSFIVKMKDEEK